MTNVSLIDGHIDEKPENADRCVCCGAIIPEGTQYCRVCAEIMKKYNEAGGANSESQTK